MALHRPGKPTQNGYLESFNGRMRELPNETPFLGLPNARQTIANWIKDYDNTWWCHRALILSMATCL